MLPIEILGARNDLFVHQKNDPVGRTPGLKLREGFVGRVQWKTPGTRADAVRRGQFQGGPQFLA